MEDLLRNVGLVAATHERLLRHKAGVEPYAPYFVDEAAPVSPEAMAFLDKIVRRRMRSAPPTLGQIMARMALDIFSLDEK